MDPNFVNVKYSEARDFAQKAIATALLRHRDKIIALLQKHGVKIDASYKDSELLIGVLQALRSNDRFKNDLGELLSNTMSDKNNFTGESGFFNVDAQGNYTVEDIVGGAGGNSGSTTSTSSTTPKTSLFGQVFTSQTISNILNTGLGILSTSLTNKSNQQLANTALQIEQEKTRQSALLAAGGGVLGTKKPLSTGAKVGIALGIVAVVGGIVWLVLRKKK